MKREAELKAAFFRELLQQLPQFYVLLHATAGAPDRAIHGGGRVTTWEFKHATPDFLSHQNQELMCARLAVASYCRYVFWWEDSKGNGKRTMVVHPKKVLERTGWRLDPEAWCTGFDHRWLVEQIRIAHRL